MRNASGWSRVVVAGIVLGMLSGPGLSRAELGLPVGGAALWVEDAIPTKLVAPIDPQGFPDPICSRCQIRTQKTTSSSSRDQATISIFYVGEAGAERVGDVVISVLLHDGRRSLAAVVPVRLVDHELWWSEVDSGPGWSWDDVASVWIELEPAR